MCLENNKNRTKSGNGIRLNSSNYILTQYEEVHEYDMVFDYHNVSEFYEHDDLFINYIPIEMAEVDSKRVISDWFENLNPNPFVFPTEEYISNIDYKNSNLNSIKNYIGYNFEELKEIERKMYEYLFSNAVENYQQYKHRQLSQEEIKENLSEIAAMPLIFFKNKFLKRMKILGINEQYFEGILLPISSVSNLEGTISQYPFKGAFIELDSFRFITSNWWFTLQSGVGIRSYIERQIEKSEFDKMYEDATREYMENAGFLSFKLSKPIEIDGIGIYKKYLFLVENLFSHIPDESRNSFSKSTDSTLKGRIGKRFLKKFLQIDKRYNWLNKNGFAYLKQNPHHRNECKYSEIVIPIVLSPDKEMLPDKIGRYIVTNNRIFAYMIDNISLLSSTKKIGSLDILFLPLSLYGMLSSSFLVPRVGKNSIILPDIFCDEDPLKIISVHSFLYQWQLIVANLDNEYSIEKMMKELDYSSSKDVILLASICAFFRDIYALNKLLANNQNLDNARHLLYILENIKMESISIMDLSSFNEEQKKIIAAFIFNFSNCKMSTVLDCMMLDFLGNKTGYSINCIFPFIDYKFDSKNLNLDKVTDRNDILHYTQLMHNEVCEYLENNKAEEESLCLRSISLIYGMDFPLS
jgi:hypothetical protein